MLTVLHFTLSHTHNIITIIHMYTHATACPQSLLHTTPHHTTPEHTHTHTCNLVFLEVFIVVVAKELVELAQPNRDLLRAPLLHRKGEAFSGHLSTAADELLKRGRYGRKEVCQGEGGRKMAGQHGTIKKSGGRVDEGGVEVSMAREREEWK